ncbi:UDP-diphosphatase [Bifidobacterium sp. DSM 109958]|uniref:Undecaprenyl-diphosphatase n=1 Tax=Bifidobacterium moraviense TaxID=2675323 RepID=A0A7Y0F0I5_9BIFI|nr:undecaprenyl-diphosphate phosphatase [Bifidobacterium sp. DSM 109958]NMM99772.1 UDP-diphosphatase [Bifidobacterium sp. DSM 109958]
MNFLQALFLGLVQALTEYLPVSSSAHIRIIGDLMIGSDPGAAFTAIIQIGTELAVLLYFRRDIARILGAWFGSLFGREGKDWKSRLGAHNRDTQMGWYIIIGTLPIVIVGVLFKSAIETTLRNLWITVTVLALFGVLLWYFDARSRQVKTMDRMTIRDAVLFGVGQMLALIPGVSRSGGTITFGRAMGYTREAAVRVAFLMAIPAVLGAGMLESVSAVKDVSACSANPDPLSEACVGAGMFPGWGPTIAATVVSFVVGYIVIIGFLKFVSTFSYKAFAVYRIGLAVVVAVLLVSGVLSPVEAAQAAAGA